VELKMPDVIPFLTYEDGIAALQWLTEAFGFRETARMTTPDGQLAHGELSTGNGHREHCRSAAAWSALPWVIDGVLVLIDDVDVHYERAKAAGATILSEPQDGPPARRYRAEDPEGHRWMFMARG
jgi:PhnB protein